MRKRGKWGMKRLGFVLPLLFLAACSTPPQQMRPVSAPPFRGAARGIDMALDSRDVAQELKGSGLHFVARYYRSPLSRWPTLSAEEARAVSANGMKLVAVWEYLSNKPEHFTYERGFSDAITAYQQARTIGQPPGSAIFFAVVFNAQEPHISGAINQFSGGGRAPLAAAGGGVPPYRVGVY